MSENTKYNGNDNENESPYKESLRGGNGQDWLDHGVVEGLEADGSDEDEDIDWEEDEQDVINQSNQSKKPTQIQREWQEEDFNKPKTKKQPKKRQVVKYNRDDHAEAIMVHKNDLFAGILHNMRCSGVLNDELLQCQILSLLPVPFLSIDERSVTTSHLANLLTWFLATFTLIGDKDMSVEEGLQGSVGIVTIEQLIHRRGGSLIQLTQIFTLLLRSIGILARYIISFQPHSFEAKQIDSIKRRKLSNDQSTTADIDEDRRYILTAWIEASLPSLDEEIDEISDEISIVTPTFNWVAIDLFTRKIEHPIKIQSKEFKVTKDSYIYIIGTDNEGYCVDLSYKYWSRSSVMHSSTKKVEINQWLKDLLISINRTKRASSTRVQSMRIQELTQLRNLESLNSLKPKSFNDFKHHPVYAMERFLKSNEMIHPSSVKSGVVMLYRGERVYNRNSIETLRSKIQWLKLLCRVKETELESPAKIAKYHRRDKEAIVVKLYGSWQTEAYEVPKIIDGVLPANQFGNLEIWGGCESLVPLGAKLITLPNAAKAAKFLNIPFVNAVFGFETNSGGYTTPKIGGIIVLQENTSTVSTVASTMTEEKLLKAEKKRENQILNNWERLVSKLLTRQSLRAKYGH